MRYYSTLRPVGPGTCPTDGMTGYSNFPDRAAVDGVGVMAWGFVDYDRELTREECYQYDLVPEGGAVNRKELERKAAIALVEAGYNPGVALKEAKQMDIEELLAIAEEVAA